MKQTETEILHHNLQTKSTTLTLYNSVHLRILLLLEVLLLQLPVVVVVVVVVVLLLTIVVFKTCLVCIC